MEKLQKIEYEKLTLHDSGYSRYNKATKKYDYWYATTLYEEVKKKKLVPFNVPLAALVLDYLPFRVDHLDYFIYQVIRVRNTDTKYPIIIDSLGTVADGYHRIAKAILDGKTTIKAYRLKEMPPIDKEEDDK